jgi:hypothetical protein
MVQYKNHTKTTRQIICPNHALTLENQLGNGIASKNWIKYLSEQNFEAWYQLNLLDW